jgi:uncharacterized protein involved in response to NO
MLVQIQSPTPPTPGLPLLQAGFRPFFLLAGLVAALQVPLWLAQWLNGVSLQLSYAPSLWHGHEMLFGFGGAALSGFLLTAVPNWTGVPTPKGWRLGLLAGMWLAARLAFALGGLLPPWLAAGLDLLVLPGLGLAVLGPLRKSGNRHNLIFLGVLSVLTLADGLVLAEMCGWGALGRNGLYLAVFLFVTMIGIVGGRIIPGFTQGGLRQIGIVVEIAKRPRLDGAALGLLAATAVAEAVAPGSSWAGALCLAAAAAHGVRLAGWQGWRTGRVPLLWVLHLGYLWLPLGLGLMGLASLWSGAPLSPADALHGLTVGAIGSMILGVMSRACLGHSGRPLVPARATVAAFVLVAAAAWLRVWAPLVDMSAGLWLSGLAWSAGFALYVTVTAPICLKPRPDGKAG